MKANSSLFTLIFISGILTSCLQVSESPSNSGSSISQPETKATTSNLSPVFNTLNYTKINIDYSKIKLAETKEVFIYGNTKKHVSHFERKHLKKGAFTKLQISPRDTNIVVEIISNNGTSKKLFLKVDTKEIFL